LSHIVDGRFTRIIILIYLLIINYTLETFLLEPMIFFVQCQQFVNQYIVHYDEQKSGRYLLPESCECCDWETLSNCYARSFIHSHALMQISCAYFWRYVGPSRVCILIQALEKLDTVARLYNFFCLIRFHHPRIAGWMCSEYCLSLNEIPFKWNMRRNKC